MKRSLISKTLIRAATTLAVIIVAIPNLFGQRIPTIGDLQAATQRSQQEQKMQQLLNNKLAYADSIVRKWEAAARTNGRWDLNYATDLENALMKLQPENLLAAGEATT